MLVPGMYTTVMLYGESRPITFPSQNQSINEPSYNPDKAYYFGQSELIKRRYQCSKLLVHLGPVRITKFIHTNIQRGRT